MSSLARRLRDAVYFRGRRAWNYSLKAMGTVRGSFENRTFERDGPLALDPRVRLPAYKSLDPFVDVAQLRSLDTFVTERVGRFLRETRTDAFHTGDLKRRFLSRGRPGSRVINLMRPHGGRTGYFNLDAADHWGPAPCAGEFEPVMEFVRGLPFASIGRVVIMADPLGRPVTAHRDHAFIGVRHEFVWFRTNLDKPLWVQDARTGAKEYVRSHTAWFDTVNQFHGADGTGRLAISLRVDGRFDDALRARLPDPGPNQASTASLWASLEGPD